MQVEACDDDGSDSNKNSGTDLRDFESFDRLARSRRATRHFLPDPIPPGLLDRLIETARWAPSGYNLQPTHFLVVTDPTIRRRLRSACMDQAQIEEAPAVLVLCGDRCVARNHFENMLRLEREAGASTPEYEAKLRWVVPLAFNVGPLGLGWLWKAILIPLARIIRPVPEIPAVHRRFWVVKQVMLTAMSLMLAAESAGLSTLPMEGFDERRVRRVLGIPRTCVVPVVIALGYARPQPRTKTRLPIETLIHREKW